VDEYQDTNYVQHRIMCLLTRQHSRICVVGDDAQSIYGFRGARIDNILQFNEQYPETRLFKLEQNYRSTQTIVQTANSLIRKNKNQIRKEVFSLNGLGERIPVIQAHSDIEEAIIVSKHIHDIHRNEKVPYSGFAILYRTNAQSRVFEESFRREALPYRIYGGVSFYQRKEIKDAIAYFRMVLNPNDEEAFKRTINYPSRGIGATTLGKIVDRANANSTSLWQVLERPMEMGLEVNKGTLAKLRKFHDLVASWHEIVDERDAFQLGKQILSESGIIADLGGDKSPEGLSRQENVNELLNGLNNFVNSAREEGNGEVGLRDFLAEVSLISDLDTDDGDSEEKITLMTVHSAKGLEFDTVFIVGMERDLFPNAMSSNSLSELEEERRLFYV
ncbi:MAG: UvrD-helicase domain-containing protein, partial [Bacteroidaceae bacterium]|nr:UvrD-helicase domain-containing protein [Bacteroidaceae bacterium]